MGSSQDESRRTCTDGESGEFDGGHEDVAEKNDGKEADIFRLVTDYCRCLATQAYPPTTPDSFSTRDSQSTWYRCT